MIKSKKDKIKGYIGLIIILIAIVLVLFLSNSSFANPEEKVEMFSGVVSSYDNNTIILYGEKGKSYTITSDTVFESGIEDYELSEEILKDNFIEGYYDENSRRSEISKIVLNVKPIFDGTITEVDGLKAIVVPDEDEYYINSRSSSVYVALPDDILFNVGDKVTVNYDGAVMEGDPLEIITLSVNGYPVD